MEARLFFIFAIVFFALSGMVGITTIILFVRLRIPAVVDELSGRRERKQIAEIRQENKESQRRNNRVQMFEGGGNVGTTGAIPPVSASKSTANKSMEDPQTGVLRTTPVPVTEEYGNTVLLESKDGNFEDQTTLLDDEGTVLLDTDKQNKERKTDLKITVVRSIFVTDSKEVLRG